MRISPVFGEPGQPARWELLRVRHRDALATAGATSQVTALSLLVSIYLQSVYAASSEEIETFSSPGPRVRGCGKRCAACRLRGRSIHFQWTPRPTTFGRWLAGVRRDDGFTSGENGPSARSWGSGEGRNSATVHTGAQTGAACGTTASCGRPVRPPSPVRPAPGSDRQLRRHREERSGKVRAGLRRSGGLVKTARDEWAHAWKGRRVPAGAELLLQGSG